MSQHHKINYLEMPAKDMAQTKRFFGALFDWKFIDYGPEYCAVENAGIDCGFYLSQHSAEQEKGSVLIVFYSDDLAHSLAHVRACGGAISKDIFAFPGGRRFHFLDPNGNEFAIWQAD